MTGAEHSSSNIEQLGDTVQNDVSSPFAALSQRAEENRIPDGAFTFLQPGELAVGMTNGIVDRLKSRLQEFEQVFGDMSNLAHTSASEYRTMEQENIRDTDDIRPV